MKFQINPAIVVFVLGICGLVLSLTEPSSGISGRIPGSILFLFIMGLGIIMQAWPKNKTEEIFGTPTDSDGYR